MKNKLVTLIGLATLSLLVLAGTRKRNFIPGPIGFTVKPVFNNTAEVVNAVTVAPATVVFVWDGVTNAIQTTTLNDLQASDTVNQNADGSYPVITVFVQ